MIPLVEPLIQLVKSGASKPAQRLEGMYALLLVAKIAAVGTKVGKMLAKEKIWQFVFQMDSSMTATILALKLPPNNCSTLMDFEEILFLEHPYRVAEYVRSKKLLQSTS